MTIYRCKIDDTIIEVDTEKDRCGRHWYPISGYSGSYTIRGIAESALLKSEIKTPFMQDTKVVKRVEVFKGSKSKGVFKLECPEEYPSEEVYKYHLEKVLSNINEPAKKFIKKWILNNLNVHERENTRNSDFIKKINEAVNDIKQLIIDCK